MATGTQLDKAQALTPSNAAVSAGAGVLWARARVLWAGMGRRQRSWTAIAALLLLCLSALLLWSALRTDWRVLYADLDSEDARLIGQTLTQAQIPFDVGVSGGVLRVPAPFLDKARLATAAKGGSKSGRLGFEIFDKPNWVGSEFDQQVNYQRALEGELEHTVGSLADVDGARVHLVLPRDSLFRDQSRPAKASVVLKLRHRGLAEGEPDAIRNLVASAVDGLSPERVVLVDAAGHLPLGPKTAEAARLEAEQVMEEKLIATLEPVTGAGNVRASVTVEYDDAVTDQTEETYDPDQSATLSMERREETAGAQAVAAGVPGSASNAPNAQSLPVYPPPSTPPQSAKSESSTYGVSKTVRHIQQNPGRVRRLTAAIVVNDRMIQAAVKGKAAVWQPRSATELRDLNTLAQAAVGFDASRGDLLAVQNIAFDENRSSVVESPLARALREVERAPELMKYCSFFAGVMALILFGVRPALKRVWSPSGPKGPGRQLPRADAAPQLPADAPLPESQRPHTQQVFEKVAEHLKRDPAQSSRLLQSWIHSE
ncbi:flagellar M-ring protein FliF [Acidobacteria bacterium AB60]|nr:flagellar M-ring protein FliF [Acidobacteria bacterium AB60]